MQRFNTNDLFGKEVLNIRVEYSRWWLMQMRAPPTTDLPTLSLFGRGETITKYFLSSCVRHNLNGKSGGMTSMNL